MFRFPYNLFHAVLPSYLPFTHASLVWIFQTLVLPFICKEYKALI